MTGMRKSGRFNLEIFKLDSMFLVKVLLEIYWSLYQIKRSTEYFRLQIYGRILLSHVTAILCIEYTETAFSIIHFRAQLFRIIEGMNIRSQKISVTAALVSLMKFDYGAMHAPRMKYYLI